MNCTLILTKPLKELESILKTHKQEVVEAKSNKDKTILVVASKWAKPHGTYKNNTTAK